MAAQVQSTFRFTIIEDGVSSTYSPQLPVPAVSITGGPFQSRRITIPAISDTDPWPDPTLIWSWTEIETPKLIVAQLRSGVGFVRLALMRDIPTSGTDITPSGTGVKWTEHPLAGHSEFKLNTVACASISSASTFLGQDGDGFPNILSDSAVNARFYKIYARNTSYTADATLEVWVVE